MMTLYGIANCSSVQKTRVWLDERGVGYTFHDFKKNGIDAATITNWLKTIPLDVLINKKGTTWRNLSAAEQALAHVPETAIALMMAHSSVIKRPVVSTEHTIFVGHNESLLQSLL